MNKNLLSDVPVKTQLVHNGTKSRMILETVSIYWKQKWYFIMASHRYSIGKTKEFHNLTIQTDSGEEILNYYSNKNFNRKQMASDWIKC